MLRRHSVSPQTAFICDSVTDLPTSSVGETLRLASQKANRSGLFVEKRSRAKQRGGGGEDVEIEQHGVAHVVTQKLRISYTKGAQVFFFVVQTAEKVTPCRGQFTVCCTWQSRLSTTMPSERSSVSAGGQQEFTRKALQHLTVHRMQKTIETREPWKTLAGPLVTEFG